MFNESERQHALGLLDEGYPVEETAHIVGCSTRSMRRWQAAWARNGTVWEDPALQKNHEDAALRNVDLARAILTLVEAEPAAFLSDHVDLLVKLSMDFPEYNHRYVSASTLYRVLRHHNYSRKKIERLFIERSVAAQKEFAATINDIPMRCIVSVDETHTAGGDMYRRFGRTQRNVRCEMLNRDPRTVPRTSTMMAVSMAGGVLWSQTVVLGGAQTSDDWRLFLQCLNDQMGTYVPGLPWDMQPDSCVVLYDNAGIHDDAGDAFMQANGMYHVRLPPYSPNLQPIEGVFAALKKHVKDLVYQNPRYLDKPLRLMSTAAARLTAEQIVGQFIVVSDRLTSLLV